MQSVAGLQKENHDLKAKLGAKDSRIQYLEEYIRSLKQKQFGTSSEKQNIDQLGLFNEAEEVDQTTVAIEQSAVMVAAHPRKKKPRVSIPKDLPREQVVYDLSDDEKVCPRDGEPLKLIGEESHEQLDIIPAQVKVIQHVRLKYACPCCDQHIVTAKKPRQPIEKSIASPGLLAYVATNKYCDALPLYRQTEIFKRIGIELDRTNLANWMIKSGELLQPLINLLQDTVLAQKVVYMDETTVQVLSEPNKTAQSQSYMWLLSAFSQEKSIALFNYDPSRKADVPTQLLADFKGALMVDGYEGYQAVCTQNQLTRLGCWAHARRKFIEVQKAQSKKVKGKAGKADQAIAYIQKLYQIEKQIKDKSIDERYQIRQQQAKPIIDKIKIWLEKSLPNVPPKTGLGKALYYLHHQWPRLERYLENGAYPIDNNFAENAIRPFAIGRKNWMFSTSQAGAKASANLYSIIETAKANSINPYEYLKYLFKELPNACTVEAVELMLPWEYKNLNQGK